MRHFRRTRDVWLGILQTMRLVKLGTNNSSSCREFRRDEETSSKFCFHLLIFNKALFPHPSIKGVIQVEEASTE